jgi:hypothetical protein
MPRSAPPLEDNGHKLALTDKIDACNGDLIVAITRAIAGNKTTSKKSCDFAGNKFILTKL